MILISLGTQEHQFTRLLKYIKELDEKDFFENKEVFIQSGFTKNIEKFQFSQNIITKDFFDDFDELIEKCELLITHGGVGTIISGLIKEKQIFAIARKSNQKEHIDDHQEELLNKLEKEKYLHVFEDYKKLEKLFEMWESNKLKFNLFKSNNQKFNQNLYLEIRKIK